MASFNGEKFIREQLDSLAAQTVLPYELVVNDDDSFDRTRDIIEAFATTAPFPVLLFRNPERIGFAENFLRAGQRCNGDVVAFCDQDDVWLAEKLERCCEMFENQYVSICVHSSRLWYGGGQLGAKFPKFQRRMIFSPLYLNPFGSHPGFSIVFRRDLLGLWDSGRRPFSWTHGEPALMSHDEWAWLLGCVFGKIGVLPDILSWYRQHESNTCGVSSPNVRELLSKSVSTVDYTRFAAIEDQCAKIFYEILGLSEHQQAAADRAVLYFRKYAAVHRLRTKIYAAQSGLADRIFAFLSILCSPSYFGSFSRRALGWRALVKDLLYGVPGFYRRPVPSVALRQDSEGGNQ